MQIRIRHLLRDRVAVLVLLLLVASARQGFAATPHSGRVTFGGMAVPGATITASQRDVQVITATDERGAYTFPELAEGTWRVRIEMPGFAPASGDVTVAPDAEPAAWELTMLPFSDVTSAAIAVQPNDAVSPPRLAPAGQDAEIDKDADRQTASSILVAAENAVRDESAGASGDVFLINGSVNNAAATPFALPASFGNNRPGRRSLYSWGLGTLVGNSAFDTRPFSFAGQPAAKPDYSNLQATGTFAGPVRIPRVRNPVNVFVAVQRSVDDSASTQAAVMPTALERAGDFSRTRDALGQPVRIIDPLTGLPFPGSVIPADRISPQAARLLRFYPAPNLAAATGHNYQTPVLTATRQNTLQSRLSHSPNAMNHVFGSLMYQRTATDAADVFGLTDASRASVVDTTANWLHRFSQSLSIRLRHQYTQLATDVTPHFANRENVSGDVGIGGNNQDPANWGPPNLLFSTIEGLASAQSASNASRTHAWGAETVWHRGSHAFTVGGDIRRQRWSVLSQQDARGTFTFTGASSGSDVADFLLGLPHTSSIAFGNADKDLRGSVYDAYVADDWRVSAAFSLNAGIRWEHETPITERLGRLVNLDVAPGFTAVSPVMATSPVGSTTGERYPDSLVRPDKRGIQPRVGIAWRPVPGSSLVVRGGYGIYRNTSVYQPIAMLLAQQPPLSKTLRVENSAASPLTLANGFAVTPHLTASTFAVDPDFRAGYAQNWQLLVQRDLPASLAMTVMYLGTRGSRLMQAYLPNTYPSGAEDPCPSCPRGFVYLSSNGGSARHAGQIHLQRRMRGGLTASVQYTLSKATDDAAAAFGGPVLRGSVAQDWRDLRAEHAPSSFDQRHLVVAQFQYTSGVGLGGGTSRDGLATLLLKGWTVTTQLTAGSGLPVTPLYLMPVAGTGMTGTLRPDYTGAPFEPATDGSYVNPLAFAAPAPGRWGTAGRNSITGPAQFSLNAGVVRTFRIGDRVDLDWRLEATNVLNRVTYANLDAVLGSPQFGFPSRANPMRRIQSGLRLRFNVDRR